MASGTIRSPLAVPKLSLTPFFLTPFFPDAAMYRAKSLALGVCVFSGKGDTKKKELTQINCLRPLYA
jgi:hypothetical protein